MNKTDHAAQISAKLGEIAMAGVVLRIGYGMPAKRVAKLIFRKGPEGLMRLVRDACADALNGTRYVFSEPSS